MDLRRDLIFMDIQWTVMRMELRWNKELGGFAMGRVNGWTRVPVGWHGQNQDKFPVCTVDNKHVRRLLALSLYLFNAQIASLA
jgi:hypothetical protein